MVEALIQSIDQTIIIMVNAKLCMVVILIKLTAPTTTIMAKNKMKCEFKNQDFKIGFLKVLFHKYFLI